MTIVEIAKELEKHPLKGFQLTKRKGIMTTTWAIYKKENHFYYFDISEEFIFNDVHKYTLEELVEEFQNGYYEIDDIVD